MAKKLDATPVKMGNLIRVENQNKKWNESYDYYAVKLEKQNGKDEMWCLFTGKEVSRLTYAVIENAAEFKPGRLYYMHTIGKTTRCFVKLMLPPPKDAGADAASMQTPVTVMLSMKLIKTGMDRARRNKEDVPGMSWLQDLMD